MHRSLLVAVADPAKFDTTKKSDLKPSVRYKKDGLQRRSEIPPLQSPDLVTKKESIKALGTTIIYNYEHYYKSSLLWWQ